MDLKILGWDLYKKSLSENIDEENVARVAVENRGGYLLYSALGESEGIIQGKFRRNAKNEAEYPKVGDWLKIEKLPNENKAVIKEILPRISKLSRKRAGEDIAEQIIATNIELVFIVQGLDGDFNIGRLERYVTMAKEGNCEAIILLNKSDLTDEAENKKQEVQKALPQIPVFILSAKKGEGIEEVRLLVSEEKTVVFVGSSGAGKSTLINALVGLDLQKTQEVRLDDSRGRHTTTKRELFLLASGGLLIDTPGMRELGLWDSQEALGETFPDIEIFAQLCKFNDCDHIGSPGCMVLKALEDGKIDRQRYERYLKLLGSTDHIKNKKDKNAAQAQKRGQRKLIKRAEYKKEK